MPPTVPQCPRCSYDLSGQVDSWRDACPITGICPECGLDFHWQHVIVEGGRLGPKWCIEYAIARIPQAIISTLGRIFTPWRLWGPLAMHHPVQFERLVPFAVLSMLALAAALYAIAFALGTTSDGFSWTLTSGAGVSFNSTQGAVYIGTPVRGVGETLLEALYEITWSRDRYAHYSPFSGAWPLLPLVSVALAPFCFLVLPASLRKAKVKPAHIIRAGLYALPLVTFPFLLIQAIDVIRGTSLLLEYRAPFDLSGTFIHSPTRVVLLLTSTLLTLFIWWTLVCTRYLRLPAPRRVALAILTISTLAALIIITLITPTEMMLDAIGH